MSVERTLHHFPLDPASRQVRLALGEKRLPFSDVVVRYWERPAEFIALSPSGLAPVRVDRTGGQAGVVCEALRDHLGYVEGLLQARDWLAGRRLSLADFAAGAHISVIDYFGDIPWRDYPAAKTWYMRVKSRPAFRPILADRWPGLAPAG